MSQTATVLPISVSPSVGVISATVIVVNDFQALLFQTDLSDVFMNANEFGENIVYTHSSLDVAKPYSVIYDDPHTSVKLGDAGFNSLRPQFQISEAVLTHRILKADTCVVRGIEYVVEDSISDGVGVTTVYLRRI